MDFVSEPDGGCSIVPCLNVNLSPAACGLFIYLFIYFWKGPFQVAFASDKMKPLYFSINYT